MKDLGWCAGLRMAVSELRSEKASLGRSKDQVGPFQERETARAWTDTGELSWQRNSWEASAAGVVTAGAEEVQWRKSNHTGVCAGLMECTG